jgi:hypothetical protein
VLQKASDMQPCSRWNWDDRQKQHIPELLAGIFAYYTIHKCGESFNSIGAESEGEGTTNINAQDILITPHNVQVLTILRLLGCGEASSMLQNHMMEIGTGEGKSIVLGALATILGLLNFSVRCVCYSEYLSSRDYNDFKDVFTAFHCHQRIVYSKIVAFSEDSVKRKGNIRELTQNLIMGKVLIPSVAIKPALEDASRKTVLKRKATKTLIPSVAIKPALEDASRKTALKRKATKTLIPSVAIKPALEGASRKTALKRKATTLAIKTGTTEEQTMSIKSSVEDRPNQTKRKRKRLRSKNEAEEELHSSKKANPSRHASSGETHTDTDTEIEALDCTPPKKKRGKTQNKTKQKTTFPKKITDNNTSMKAEPGPNLQTISYKKTMSYKKKGKRKTLTSEKETEEELNSIQQEGSEDEDVQDVTDEYAGKMQEILLVDEVDVFFGKDFYGQTYNQVTFISTPELTVLIKKIWQEKSSNPTLRSLSSCPAYQKFIGDFPQWTFLINNELQLMCSQVNSFNQPAYIYNSQTDQIGYVEHDTISFSLTYGYRTLFAYMHELDAGNVKAAHKSKFEENHLNMQASLVVVSSMSCLSCLCLVNVCSMSCRCLFMSYLAGFMWAVFVCEYQSSVYSWCQRYAASSDRL